MRWEQLFSDLEAQFAAQADGPGAVGDGGAELASRTRAEYGQLSWVDRVRGAQGRPVSVTCRGGGVVTGRVVEVGVDWLLLGDDLGRDVLVATQVVRAISGLGAGTAVPAWSGVVDRRLDLRRALRGLARDRATVHVVLDDGTTMSGTVDRVGADFLELAEHAPDEPRRRGAVTAVRTVVLDAVAVVRSLRPAQD